MMATKTKKTTRKPGWFARQRARLNKYMAARPHRTFRRSKWFHRQLGGKPLGPVTKLVLDSFKYLWQERKILGGLTVVYIALTYLLVGGISQTDFLDLKDVTLQVFQGHLDALGTAFSLFTDAMSGIIATPLSETQQMLASIFIFLFWLSLIWALRMRFAKEKIKIRDAVYNSGAPILSSLMVVAVIAIQLLPGAVGLLALTQAIQYGLLVGGVEFMLFAVAAVLLCVLSLYWVVGSAVALIVVTLPQMYPWHALSRASELVVGQRWRLILRVLVLGLVISLAWMLVLIPALLLDSWLRFDWLPLVPVVASLLSGLTITYTATYVYKLYRGLL